MCHEKCHNTLFVLKKNLSLIVYYPVYFVIDYCLWMYNLNVGKIVILSYLGCTVA